MVSSINSAVQASVFQLLGASNKKLGQTVAALASGNRLISASTDIAALSIATGLQSEVSTLRSASQNIAQAASFLQVADGGLEQSGEILQRMQALAVQANSGALSDSAREGLNIEFQQLAEELDRISNTTSFNDVKLLDGSLSENSAVEVETALGEQASGQLDFLGNVGAGETVVLNGVTLTEGTDFSAGATVQETIDNLASALNNDARFEGFSFSRQSLSLEIEADAAGEAGNQFTIDQASSTASFNVSGADALSGSGVYSLQGGSDGGISSGDVQANGTVGDSLLASGTGEAASTTASFTNASDIQAGDTIQIDDGEGGFTTFTFTAGAPSNANEIQIGSSLEETLDNAAQTINAYEGADDYGVRQLTASVDGNNLVLTNNQAGNATDVSGAALDVSLGTTGGTLSNAQLDNGSMGGIDVSNVSNAAFTGSVSGFEAQYLGGNQVRVSLEVGGETYTAEISNTDVASDTTVRFTSENGGSFDVTLAGGNGETVASQADADTFAARLDAAFSGVNFTQTRDVSSFSGSGSLSGASLELTTDGFSGLQVESVSVNGGSAQPSIEIEINGETYRASNFGSEIGAGERVEFVSTRDSSNRLTFTNGDNAIDLTSSAAAEDLQVDLENSLGIPGGSGAAFQIGSSSSDTVNLSIGNVSSDSLFGGLDLNLLTAENASQALDTLSNAIDYVTSQRADVGSFQSALGYAAANLDSAIQNQDAARATLEDTDIAQASTNYALQALQNQSQIATLAQSNRMQGNLLQLLVQ